MENQTVRDRWRHNVCCCHGAVWVKAQAGLTERSGLCRGLEGLSAQTATFHGRMDSAPCTGGTGSRVHGVLNCCRGAPWHMTEKIKCWRDSSIPLYFRNTITSDWKWPQIQMKIGGGCAQSDNTIVTIWVHLFPSDRCKLVKTVKHICHRFITQTDIQYFKCLFLLMISYS